MEISINTCDSSNHHARKTVMETVKVCLRASTGAVLLKGRRFLCVCARVCECVPGWGWVAVRRSRSTIAVFGGPHCRPCAVDYHTAVRMRSRQKQHDSPTLPDSTLPPPMRTTPSSTQAQGGLAVRWAHNGPWSGTCPLFLSPHTRQSNYTVGCKEGRATRCSSPLPTDLYALLDNAKKTTVT